MVKMFFFSLTNIQCVHKIHHSRAEFTISIDAQCTHRKRWMSVTLHDNFLMYCISLFAASLHPSHSFLALYQSCAGLNSQITPTIYIYNSISPEKMLFIFLSIPLPVALAVSNFVSCGGCLDHGLSSTIYSSLS